MTARMRLRKHNEDCGVDRAQSDRAGGFDLAERDRLQSAPDDLRDVGTRKERDDDERVDDDVSVEGVGQKFREDKAGNEEPGEDWPAAREFDDGGRNALHRGERAGAGQG